MVPLARGEQAGISDSDMAGLRKTMSRSFGVVRSREAMEHGLEAICRIGPASDRDLQAANFLATAGLIAVAALKREESRGAHYRSDFPEPRKELKQRRFLTLNEARNFTKHMGSLVA
jgi:L-aspartate oxidase